MLVIVDHVGMVLEILNNERTLRALVTEELCMEFEGLSDMPMVALVTKIDDADVATVEAECASGVDHEATVEVEYANGVDDNAIELVDVEKRRDGNEVPLLDSMLELDETKTMLTLLTIMVEEGRPVLKFVFPIPGDWDTIFYQYTIPFS